MPSPVAAKYGLTRDNFVLDPVADIECFARDDIPTHLIAESLDIDLVTGLAPKRLVWGPYGGGKTHTLMRTMHELGALTNIRPVRVECPDLGKKSRFHDLYREGIMREIGQDWVLSLIEEAVQSVGMARREELMLRLKERFENEEMAKAAIRLVDPNFDELRLWRWLSGVSLSRNDLDDLGQTQDLTEAEAARLSDVVILLGGLLHELRGERLVLILDEMERLRGIGAETVTTFVSGFTRLVDPNQKSVSILIGSSADQVSQMVDVFAPAGPVMTRLGTDSMIEIQALDDPGVDVYIAGVIRYLRDSTADLNSLLADARQATNEQVVESLFPLTEDAVAALKSRLTQVMTPREIGLKMTRALGRAYRSSSPVVTSRHFID